LRSAARARGDRIEPGRVFDRVVGLDGVPDGYRAMNDRESIKVMVNP
jgi:threonine dehydrogenase-like Zn-dependent dehydrogenase